MAVPGPLYGTRLGGPGVLTQLQVNGNASFAMGPLNAGWCARFTARSTKDVKGVKVRWATVTAAGQYSVRIETITATTGKPSGTLYDASAEISAQVPVDSTVVTSTFASLPTTGLTAGTEYGVVLLTTTGGTTHTLRSHAATQAIISVYPTVVLTAADGTTRTNFAEVASSVPIISIVLEDDTEETVGLANFGGTSNGPMITDGTGLRGAAMKFTIASSVEVVGYEFMLGQAGTPPSGSNVRCRIFTSADATVSNSTVTLDYDSLITGAGNKMVLAPLATPVTLTAGTYRLVLDEPAGASTATTNCWRSVANTTLTGSTYYPTEIEHSTCPNQAAGPIVWTDTASDTPIMALILNDIPSAGGGGGGPLIGGRLAK